MLVEKCVRTLLKMIHHCRIKSLHAYHLKWSEEVTYLSSIALDPEVEVKYLVLSYYPACQNVEPEVQPKFRVSQITH